MVLLTLRRLYKVFVTTVLLFQQRIILQPNARKSQLHARTIFVRFDDSPSLHISEMH